MERRDIESQIRESIATKERLAARCAGQIEALCRSAEAALRAGGKLMLCGNGGSSCDAAHAAGELVGWFEDKRRDGIAAIALGHEIPTLTAIGNDAGFEQVFARQLRAIGRTGDLLIGISTSGTSKNVVLAMRTARELGIATAALISERDGPMVELADVAVRVPSTSTPRIQECHLAIVHVLCAWLEAHLTT
jgi:D-sedoheptulose 7-phosphate isomerase